MTPFGVHSVSYTHGYDLPMCLSHLEGLLDGEVCAVQDKGGSKHVMKRIEMVEQAIALLTEVADLGEEG